MSVLTVERENSSPAADRSKARWVTGRARSAETPASARPLARPERITPRTAIMPTTEPIRANRPRAVRRSRRARNTGDPFAPGADGGDGLVRLARAGREPLLEGRGTGRGDRCPSHHWVHPKTTCSGQREAVGGSCRR
ncbi:hypothetical protein KCH_65000 [Kitasatospora cheerisanensis KCTC 2395]|uniref:Uncharacterized protein n=1 Tax=Kitasatospora cheerisanensis KCTC 2395 TaxID=1348663 RepID=A0A066YV38_9ACTN|nr:hypothetical protein KCH_65000 [Kitasatospora cheerisanensis KCTC 2395]